MLEAAASRWTIQEPLTASHSIGQYGTRIVRCWKSACYISHPRVRLQKEGRWQWSLADALTG
jgi:hypothetical protein